MWLHEDRTERRDEAMSYATERFLEAVDVRDLHEFDWPIVRLVSPSFVEHLELQRYKRRLLDSQRWDRIRAVPHRDAAGNVSSHRFELYGVPASTEDASV
jgi:hypothetical protein